MILRSRKTALKFASSGIKTLLDHVTELRVTGSQRFRCGIFRASGTDRIQGISMHTSSKMGVAFTAALLMCATATAEASTVVLDFERISAGYPETTFPQIGDFYNGGFSGAGTTGINYGIQFSADAVEVCLNTAGATCGGLTRGGTAATSDRAAFGFLSRAVPSYINVAAGFVNAVTFNYTGSVFYAATIDVFSGLSGTGTLLGSVTLLPDFSDYPAHPECYDYPNGGCVNFQANIAFAGIGKSIFFEHNNGSGSEGVYDDITFNTAAIPSVPEPTVTALFPVGLVLLALWRSGACRRNGAGRKQRFMGHCV